MDRIDDGLSFRGCLRVCVLFHADDKITSVLFKAKEKQDKEERKDGNMVHVLLT